MTHLVSFTTVATIAAALVGAAPSAHAGVTRTITSGLGCVQAYDMEGTTSHGDDAAFYNDSPNGFRTAVCRIDQNTPYMLGVTAALDVFDRNYTQEVTCRVIARSTWTIWGSSASSSGSNPAPQRLNVEISFAEHQLATAHVLCYLPAVYQGNRSGVVGLDGSRRTLF